MKSISNSGRDTFHCEAPFHQIKVKIITPPPTEASISLNLSPDNSDENFDYESGWTNQAELDENFEIEFKSCHLMINYQTLSNIPSNNLYTEMEIQCINSREIYTTRYPKNTCINDEPDL